MLWPAVKGSHHEDTKSTKENLGVGPVDGTLNAQRSTLKPWEVLTAEMKRYESEIGPTGQVSSAAPSGYHDDCVMALALAEWGCRMFGVEPGGMLRIEGGGRRTVTLA